MWCSRKNLLVFHMVRITDRLLVRGHLASVDGAELLASRGPGSELIFGFGR
jgi:hypothetical protein